MDVQVLFVEMARRYFDRYYTGKYYITMYWKSLKKYNYTLRLGQIIIDILSTTDPAFIPGPNFLHVIMGSGTAINTLFSIPDFTFYYPFRTTDNDGMF